MNTHSHPERERLTLLPPPGSRRPPGGQPRCGPARRGGPHVDAGQRPCSTRTVTVAVEEEVNAILVAGTASDAGKSVITAGICRWLVRQGITVAPFKAQNMSLNSFVTADGCEIGRAQAMQAAAARVEPEGAMNPVLLKPGARGSSQVMLLGEPFAEADALSYADLKPKLRPAVLDSLAALRSRFDVVDVRGRGQPGRDQPAGRRPRQHGARPGGRAARHRGGRHRPGRGVRRHVRYAGAAQRTGPGAGGRLRRSTGSGATPGCSHPDSTC